MISSSAWTPEVFWGNLNDRYHSNGNTSDHGEGSCHHFGSSSSLFESIEAWNASGDQSSDGEETSGIASWTPNEVAGSSYLEALQVYDLGFSLLENDEWNNDGERNNDGELTEPSIPSSPAPQELAHNARFESMGSESESAWRESHSCASPRPIQGQTAPAFKRCPTSAQFPSKAPARKKIHLKRVKRLDRDNSRKPLPPPSHRPNRKKKQQKKKEHRSGFFHREQILSLKQSLSEEEIDILG